MRISDWSSDVCSSDLQPTRAAIIPRLIPGRQLPAANSLNMTVVQFGAIAGPLLAGVLIPSAGLQLLYLLASIFLLATLWAVWKLPARSEERRVGKGGVRSVRSRWWPAH